jgi:2-keto-4-pentenoate hydratase/2-oxohepta-3-ene-1,7-dioic acid hydratase in catechol pathway
VKVARFAGGDGKPRFGVIEGDSVVELDLGSNGNLARLIGQRDWTRVAAAAPRGQTEPVARVRLLAPVDRPSKVICIGINYVPHMEETNFERPGEPVVFAKLVSAITGPTDPIVLPKAAPRRVDYEAELVVVVGVGGRDIDTARAMEHVAGFTVGNDVSARDWQLKKPGGQWLLGKSFDTFLPLGPWIASPDEIADVARTHVRCTVNGEVLQDDVLGNLIFDIPTLVAYVSQVATLEPGDLIMTGTPGGVGQSRTPPRWLADGDVVETSVDGIGSITNPVRTAT